MTQTINFSRYTSIKIGPTVEVKVINDPCTYAGEYLIGRGYNLLVSPTPPPLAILGERYSTISQEGTFLRVGAGVTNAALYRYVKAHNLGGLEFIAKLPGSVGGMVVMNAGLKEYEIFGAIVGVETIDGYQPKEEIAYGYRTTNLSRPVLEVVFDLVTPFDVQKEVMFKNMRANQPSAPSAGSCFKNPVGDYAGRLIEAVGLKGYRVGGMAFSEVHANFLTNEDRGTFEDAITLISMAKERVLGEFGITLELEIKVI